MSTENDNREELNELDENTEIEADADEETDDQDAEDFDFEDDSEDDSEDDQDAEDTDDEENDEDSEESDASEDDKSGDEKAEAGKSDQDKTDSSRDDEKQDFATLDEEIKSRVKPDYIPGSKEFFTAAEAEAKKAIEAEFGEYDEFDTKHIARFNYFVNEAINNRKAEYKKAVQIIAGEHQTRKTYQNINSQMDKLLPKPEHKKQLAEALNKISHAAYLEIEESLAKGDPSKLLDLAKKVAGTHGKLLDGKAPEGKKPIKTQQDKKKGEVFGSDILGF